MPTSIWGCFAKTPVIWSGARRSFETFLSKASKMDYQGSIRTVQRELAAIVKMQRQSSTQIRLGTLVLAGEDCSSLPVGQAFEPDGLTLRGSGVRLESLTYRGCSGPANRIPLKLIRSPGCPSKLRFVSA